MESQIAFCRLEADLRTGGREIEKGTKDNVK